MLILLLKACTGVFEILSDLEICFKCICYLGIALIFFWAKHLSEADI
jgi:hypothetical protein